MSYWDEIKDLIYDAENNEFYSPEQREEIIAEAFGIFAGYTDNTMDIPGDFTKRKQTFYSPLDLVKWIEEAGISPEYVYIFRFQRGNDVKYTAYID